MMFDLRAVVIAASFVLASIVVAAAEGSQDPSAKIATGASANAGQAHSIRVILPAPWEPAPASSGTQAMVQK